MSLLFSFQRGVFWGIEKKPGETVQAVLPRLPVVFREIFSVEAEGLSQALGLDSSEQALQRFNAGRRCFGGFSGDQLTCCGWVSQGEEWIGEMEARFIMQPGEAYLWDFVTLPSYRRQGLYSALLNHILRELLQEGCQRIWIGSNLENRPSIQGFQRAGFWPIAQVWFLRLLAFRFFLMKPYQAVPRELLYATRRAFSPQRALRIMSGA